MFYRLNKKIVFMKIYISIALYFVFLSFLNAQTNFDSAEKELSRLNDYFVNADNPDHRVYAHNKFKPLFEKTLKEDSSFYYPFDSLKWISKLMAPDSTFRIFSWQVQSQKGKFSYFGYIQKRSGELISLKDNKEEYSDMEYELFSDKDWYGQVYYNIVSYIRGSMSEYIVFGYKFKNNEKVKVAEPIVFENEEIVFGKPVFEDTLREGLLKNRIVLRTSINAASKLNYDPDMKMIIYDHTINITLPHSEKNTFATVPDGSYHGYKWDGKKWFFIDKVFNQIYDEKMIPVRSKESEKVDIINGKKISK